VVELVYILGILIIMRPRELPEHYLNSLIQNPNINELRNPQNQIDEIELSQFELIFGASKYTNNPLKVPLLQAHIKDKNYSSLTSS